MFKELIVEDIEHEIINNNNPTDLSDLGNSIGIAIAKYISKDLGFELEDFISGLKHGISLKDGTH